MHVLGLMSSGFPLRLRTIQAAIQEGKIPNARIGAVVCNKPGSPIIELASAMSIPYFVIDNPKTEAIDIEARDILQRHDVELILLAGYKRKIGPVLLEAFPEHILNIHPGPIPRFGGKGMGGIKVQRAVLAAGAKYTGPVVHIVNEEYDRGPILGHYPIKIRPEDTAETLDQRCLEAGSLLYIQVIKDFLYRLDHPEDF